jgi:hypothetical protein
MMEGQEGSMHVRTLPLAAVSSAVVVLAACTSTSFVSTWKAPDATPFAGPPGQKVVTIVMAQNQGTRRAGEDALAREVTARGNRVGVPLYSITPAGDAPSEAQARAAVEKEGAVGVIVLRPIGSRQETYTTPVTYAGPGYSTFWGGYWGYGWGAPWGTTVGGEVRTDLIVSIETMIYSVAQNKLVWAGQSKTTNPENLDRMVHEIAASVVQELRKQKLL